MSKYHYQNRTVELTGICAKIKTRQYAPWGLMRENLAAQKYLCLQYFITCLLIYLLTYLLHLLTLLTYLLTYLFLPAVRGDPSQSHHKSLTAPVSRFRHSSQTGKHLISQEIFNFFPFF